MSREEREKALDDVHGISNDTKEDPGFINLCLKEMDDHLSTMKAGTSYELAESLSPEYVQNPDFRLMFIRADFYVTKAAAERMIKFFDFKKRLFGTELLGREITLNDFDEDGMAVMKSGYAQISPYRDMSGRPIVLFVLEHKKNYQNPENLVRIDLLISARRFAVASIFRFAWLGLLIRALLLYHRLKLDITCSWWLPRCQKRKGKALHVSIII